MNDFCDSRELFQLRSGRVILDEDMSDKMFLIKTHHPERADETSSGFEWSEMGMANLFAILYDQEARYCSEHKCWYTYDSGAWRRDEGAGTPTTPAHGDETRVLSWYQKRLRTLYD